MTSKDSVKCLDPLELEAQSGVMAAAVETIDEGLAAGSQAFSQVVGDRDPTENALDSERLVERTATVVRNADVDWDRFDPDSYLEVNYRTVRDDDREIVQIIRDFFAGSGLAIPPVGGAKGGSGVEAVDVGSGTNLYPALAMLPFADSIRLFERGKANVAWLEGQLREGYDKAWEPFWAELAMNHLYGRVAGPREMFGQKVEIEQGDLFALPARRYHLGTMFFVAESMSTEHKEFASAVEAFVGSLLPGAPFAAAFMENSHGYEVDGVWFPAYAVKVDGVQDALSGVASGVSTSRVLYGASGALRGDHEAMIVATGRAK